MAPELAVYLHGNMPARVLRPDVLSREGFRIAVQWSLRQYAGEDVGSQNTAHLLDQDDLQLAAGEGGFFGYLEVPPRSNVRWR
jgi:hypothetical protein